MSPGLDEDVVVRCQEVGIPCLPGIATASELIKALKLSITAVKFFPASTAGGPKAIKALFSAFRQVDFLPTGGINAENAREYLNLSCVPAVGGSWMVPSKLVDAGKVAELVDLISTAVATVNDLRSDQA